MEKSNLLTPETLEISRRKVVKRGNTLRIFTKIFLGFAVWSFLGIIVINVLFSIINKESFSAGTGLTRLCLFIGILISLFIAFLCHKAYLKVFDPYSYVFVSQFLPFVISERFTEIISFRASGGINEKQVQKSRLFDDCNFDTYHADHYLHACYSDLEFEFCQLKISGREFEINDKESTILAADFSGIFIIFPFDHFCDTPTFIYPRNSMKTSNVTTESDEFNRAFTIICENELDALRFLTPHMMERILSLKTFASKDIKISFVSDLVFVAVKTGEKMFEFDITKPISVTRQKLDKEIDFIIGVLKLIDIKALKS
jgi:hypothetical protein